MMLGIIIGFAVGLNLGIWLGKLALERLYKPLIEGYKKDVDIWFNEYMKMLDWYQQMQAMYYKEALKNLGIK